MGGLYGVFTQQLDGSRLRFVASGDYARWSPSSRRIVYTSDQIDAQGGIARQSIQSVDPEGGSAQTLRTTTDSRVELGPAAWSPDGKQLAWFEVHCSTICDGTDDLSGDSLSLMVAKSDGSHPSLITSFPASRDWGVGLPAFTPDSANILVAPFTLDYHCYLYSVPVHAGAKPKILYDGANGCAVQPDVASDGRVVVQGNFCMALLGDAQQPSPIVVPGLTGFETPVWVKAAAPTLIWPFAAGREWRIIQGYNSTYSHTCQGYPFAQPLKGYQNAGGDCFGFDLVAVVGSTAGTAVRAPVSGKVSYLTKDGEILCIDTNDGKDRSPHRRFAEGYARDDPRHSDWQIEGCPLSSGTGPHLHFGIYQGNGCLIKRNSVATPMPFGEGNAIEGAWAFPAPNPFHAYIGGYYNGRVVSSSLP